MWWHSFHSTGKALAHWLWSANLFCSGEQGHILPESFWCAGLVPFHSHREPARQNRPDRCGLELLPGEIIVKPVWKWVETNVAMSLAKVAAWTILFHWTNLMFFILEKKAIIIDYRQPLARNPRLYNHQGRYAPRWFWWLARFGTHWFNPNSSLAQRV